MLFVKFILLFFGGAGIASLILKNFDLPTPAVVAVFLFVLIWTGFLVPSILVKQEHYKNDKRVSVWSVFTEFFGVWLFFMLIINGAGIWYFLVRSDSWLGAAILFLTIPTVFVARHWLNKRTPKEIKTTLAADKAGKTEKRPLKTSQEARSEYYDTGSYEAFHNSFNEFEKKVLGLFRLTYNYDLEKDLYGINPRDFDIDWLGGTFRSVISSYSQQYEQTKASTLVTRAADYLLFQVCKNHPNKPEFYFRAMPSLKLLRTRNKTRGKQHLSRIDKLLATYEKVEPDNGP